MQTLIDETASPATTSNESDRYPNTLLILPQLTINRIGTQVLQVLKDKVAGHQIPTADLR